VRDLTVTAVVSAEPDTVYERLVDFPRYVELASSVRAVTMSDDRRYSSWEVSFRNGILRWTEEDRYDPVARRIEFYQTNGDMERLDGWWSVAAAPGGSRVTFFAVLDLGLPGLAEFLEPVAERALRENIIDLIAGLFDADFDAGVVEIEGPGLSETVPSGLVDR
jgi:ribosome-associated toxin RatA of RatAB toxin-antitoxin module